MIEAGGTGDSPQQLMVHLSPRNCSLRRKERFPLFVTEKEVFESQASYWIRLYQLWTHSLPSRLGPFYHSIFLTRLKDTLCTHNATKIGRYKRMSPQNKAPSPMKSVLLPKHTISPTNAPINFCMCRERRMALDLGRSKGFDLRKLYFLCKALPTSLFLSGWQKKKHLLLQR